MDDDFSNADDIDLDEGDYDNEDIDTLDDDIANDVEPDNDDDLDEDEEEEEEEEISIIRGITGSKPDIISHNKVYDNFNNQYVEGDAYIDIFLCYEQDDGKIIGNDWTMNMWPNEYHLKENTFPLKKIEFENSIVNIPNHDTDYIFRYSKCV